MDEKMFKIEMQLDEAKTREDALKILRSDPELTEEKAQKMAALWPEPESEKDEPEKGFWELLLEAISTEDLTKKEAIYDKLVEQEMKRVRKEIFDRLLGTTDKHEFITLGLQLNPAATEQEMAELFDKLRGGYLKKKEDKFVSLVIEAILSEDPKEQSALLDETGEIALKEYSGDIKDNQKLQGKAEVH